MLGEAREHPSLPQNDRDPRERAAELARVAADYQWTDSEKTLPGVPLSKDVPRGDNPTIPWLLEAAEVGVDIAENQLEVKLRSFDERAAKGARELYQEHFADLRDTLQTIRRQSSPEVSGFLTDVRELADGLESLHRARLREHIEGMRQLFEENYAPDAPPTGLDPYRALFATLPLPAIADTFMDDACFARLRVAGPNSVLIECVAKLPDNFPLTASQYRQVMGQSDELERALAEGRIFLLDYRELAALVPAPPDQIKTIYRPIALFALPSGQGSLVPVAIQCGQEPQQYPIILRAAGPTAQSYWSWQMARTVVQVADGNYHELFVHLARTHLVMEAIAVATHRNLAATHPLNLLLVPHVEGTLFINDLAAKQLIAAGGPIDAIFGATIESDQQATSNDRLAFDFQARMLKNDLERRGVAPGKSKLTDYPYRDDALSVWDAIESWVSNYVSVYYSGDADVLADYELQGWVTELQTNGKLRGLPAIGTREQLTSVLTMAIFTGTAQHAAVNFPQRPDMSYAPAISGAGWAPAPNPSPEHTQAQWLKLLPPTSLAQQQLGVLWALGSVYYRPLGDYRSNEFPYLAWFRDERIVKRGGPLDAFQDALKTVEQQIAARNRARAVPYPFLQPSQIPNSINI